MFMSVLTAFFAALIAPWVHRLLPRVSGWLFAVVPLLSFLFFAGQIVPVARGEAVSDALPWVSSLGIVLSFHLDGLSLLFTLLILGTGTLVMVYSTAYMEGHRHFGRFYSFMFLFMSSMLGLVLADNLITLFVFWELTSLSSYLLIAFEYGRESSRKAALQALLVTGAGGLALLAGMLLLCHAGGSLEISELVGRGDAIRSHWLYLPILLLILAGAFTKSAQFPFHFWLPSAMEAPTAVSAYLHSATMVKAGVYLLARLAPVLAGTDAWHYILSVTGAVTMLAGAVMALGQKDLKRLLAYSTVSALGTLTLLLGLDTTQAVKAAMVFLLVHALYKGALFLVSGAVDHMTGTRDVDGLGGLWRLMPVIAVAGGLAALSMAGLPPLLGYLGKELLYEAKIQAPQASVLITSAGVLANMAMFAVAGIVGIRPFFGMQVETPRKPHKTPPSIWLGPLVLSASGLALGLFPATMGDALVAPAVSAVLAEPTVIELALWHGINLVLALSLFTYAAGALLYLRRDWLYRAAGRLRAQPAWGPSNWYDRIFDGVTPLARLLTRTLQSGYLRYYLMTVLGVSFALLSYTLMEKTGLQAEAGWSEPLFHEWVIAAVILAAALFAASSLSRLATVAAVGVVGYGVALIYILFGAPDLAMTQVCIETLSVILFVLVLYRLPRFSVLTGRRARARDVLIALGNGAVMTALVLTATSEPVRPRISSFFAENSLLQAHGRNVVNVILVDFRGLDTLGEITVLAVASIGVYVLLRMLSGKERS